MKVSHLNSELDHNSSHLENIITDAINKALLSTKQLMGINEWMSLKEGAKYAGVSYNTFMKFREMGLKVSEIDGVKRVSRKEIDHFLENHSF
ncbi:helix-turn-helix domain-containing protein [Lysinibacillus sp. JNUCC-52]|uniref:helix-turn-helix domain-containing protein n=1 Tax=Lysinibacillus sp. JNUCC-52 TaxID=2792480 RepID=UPI00193736D0|nr:helix-turn-helix domain-containing protein [Lysinibacillus sp. JNUCC-52]